MLKQVPGRGADEDQIIIVVPVELKSLVEPIRALISTAEKARKSTRGGGAIDYGEVEKSVAERTAAIERSTHADVLRSLDVDAPRVVVGGRTYARIGYEPGTYNTLAGSLVVDRTVYRQDGVRNAPVVDAISLRTGAIGRGWLPLTAQAMAHRVQQGTSREAEAAAKQTPGTLPYSRVSYERVAHQVAEHWQREHVDIEDQLAQEFEIPDTAYSVSVAVDRVSIPMEEPKKRPVGRPRKNAAKRPVDRNFRMGYAAVVTIHDKDGESLHSLRFGCMPQGDPELLCAEMSNEVYRMIEKRSDLKIKLLADGAPEMWNLLEPAFPPSVFGKVERGIDFWHLIEKLSPAANLIFGEDPGNVELHRWRASLRRSSKAAADILEELRESGYENRRRNSKKPVHEAITYLENHMERMNFAAAIRKGMPIGSGNAEATCKTLIAVRMKRSGSRWKTESGERVIKLRAVALSDRWADGMARLHASRRTAVRVVA